MNSEVAAKTHFSAVRYAQCWEDADILLEALNIQPGHTCLAIASAGDNALAMVSQGPARVIASADRLMQYLGVVPGAVSPFGLINDTGTEVEVVLDRALMAMDPLNFHPLDNSKTTAVSAQGLLRFLESTGHSPTYLDLGSGPMP